jgi:PBP1b-binding outer membrane lipoprotein LpoB
MLNTVKRYSLPFIVVAIATSLTSCSSSPTSRQDTASVSPAPVTTTTSNVSSPSMAQLRAKSANLQPSLSPVSSTEKAPSVTNVTLYTSDVQCQVLVPQKLVVPEKEAVTDSVSKILEQRDSGDFSLSGYRVNIKNGTATVDLRIAPQSKRQLASLSSCEQFALFGSLRKTLTSNAQWKIKQVRFTERGEDIEL